MPRFGILYGKGKCRVLSIENDFVTLLTNRDERVFIHRNRVVFTNR